MADASIKLTQKTMSFSKIHKRFKCVHFTRRVHIICAFGVIACCVLLATLGPRLTAFRAGLQRVWNTSFTRATRPRVEDLTTTTQYLSGFKSPYIKEEPIHHAGYEFAAVAQAIPKSGGKDTSEVTKLVMMVDVPPSLRGSSREFFGACPVSACALSYVRSNDNLTADAVVFHDLPEKLAVPQRTSPTQVYVFMHMESPVHVSDRYKSTLWNAAFNWTWSYRVDADIFCPVAYLKRAREVPTRAFLLSLRRNKTKAVAWFSSHCNVQSRRDEYVARLRRVIPVDIYGRCGSLQCTGPTCEQMLSTDYMFYLSYENSFCQDYVTEKFFRVFKENVYVVPVVRGGADYDKYFMRGVYVDSEWFESPEDLGRHLLELMEDEETYVDMLWRRAHFLYHEHGIVDAKCQLCHRLHNVHRFAKTYPDLYEWNHHNRCRPPSPLKLKKSNKQKNSTALVGKVQKIK